MITISNKLITKPAQLGTPAYTHNDGLGLYKPNHYLVKNCSIDMYNFPDDTDEAASVTWGASATFKNCIIRNAGKLVLCGSGNRDEHYELERGKQVIFDHCILENFGRRGPEVQDNMHVVLDHCLVRNWASSGYFTVRSFAAWAHDGGSIEARNTVFWMDRFSFRFKDIWNHVGQAMNDSRWFLKPLQLFNPFNYVPGCCRGLTAGPNGSVQATGCYRNHWWIRIENRDGKMDKDDALNLIMRLERECGKV